MQQESNKPQSDGLECTVARDLAEVEAIRPIWEQMQRNQSYPIINADIDRYLSVLQAQKDKMQPYVMVLSHKDSTVALVIGRIEMHQVTCQIGYKVVCRPSVRCLAVVYGGVLGEQNEAVYQKTIAELQSILQAGKIDMAYFSHLKTDSVAYRIAKTRPNFLCRDHCLSVDLHWQTHIPDTVEAFYNTIPSKHKREWRRCERRLAEACNGPVEVVCYCKEQEIDYIMEVACRISALTYKHAINVGVVDDALTRTLLSQTARDGRLRAYIMYVKGAPCAFEFGSHYGTVFFVEYMGSDPKLNSFGPGALLWMKVIEKLCCDPAIDTLDYGFGNAAYKERLGTESWTEGSVYIFAPRLYPIAVNMLQSAVRGLSLGLNRLSDKAGFTRWLKRRWRDRLQENTHNKK